MNLIHKKMLVGTLAAGLLISGGLVLQHNEVFADETSSTAKPAPQKDKYKDSHHRDFRGSNDRDSHDRGPAKGGFEFGQGRAFDFAAILGIEQSVLKDEIKQGKTLAQIAQEKANLTEEALLAKLTEAETKKMDDALSSGKIKQEQADKIKSGLADRLKKIITAKPQAMNFTPGPREGGMFGSSSEIAQILGISEGELNKQRQAGKSLAEIAQEKGITEDQLIAKLKDNLTDELKSFVERKGGGPQMKPGHDGSRFKGQRPAPTTTPQAQG